MGLLKLHFPHDGRIGTDLYEMTSGLALIDWSKKDVRIGISSYACEPLPPFWGPSVHITQKKSATTAEPEKNESRDHHPCQAKSTFSWDTPFAALKQL